MEEEARWEEERKAGGVESERSEAVSFWQVKGGKESERTILID